MKRKTRINSWTGMQILLLMLGVSVAPVRAFDPPEAPPIEYYQNIWTQSPFDRQVLPEKPPEQQAEYSLQSTWRIGQDRYISIVSRQGKGTVVVSSNPDKSDENTKLLSFQEADIIDDVSAKVEVNGQQIDVRFDRQLLAAAAPRVQAPAPVPPQTPAQANKSNPNVRRVVIPSRNTQTQPAPVVRRTQSRPGIVLPGNN